MRVEADAANKAELLLFVLLDEVGMEVVDESRGGSCGRCKVRCNRQWTSVCSFFASTLASNTNNRMEAEV